MKRLNFAIFSIILILLLPACSKKTWTEVKINNTDVKASFPSEPGQKSRNLTLPGFGKVTLTMAKLKSKDITYTISAMEILDSEIEFNDENISPHSMLRKGASLYETNQVYLGALSGKEFKMNFKGRKAIQRMFLDSNKMYTIITIFKDSQAHNADIFINSAKL